MIWVSDFMRMRIQVDWIAFALLVFLMLVNIESPYHQKFQNSLRLAARRSDSKVPADGSARDRVMRHAL